MLVVKTFFSGSKFVVFYIFNQANFACIWFAGKDFFGLLGKEENALTFAFGFVMQQCPYLLQKFLASIDIRGMRIKTLQKAEIRLQEKDKYGITDIEIRVPSKLYVIVEAKVGGNIPEINQCKKYIEKLKEAKEETKRLVIILDREPGPIVDKYRREDRDCAQFLSGIHWSKLEKCVQKLMNTVGENEQSRWLQQLFRFMREEYNMRSFTAEVWIAPANTEPLPGLGKSLHDTHIEGRIYYQDQDKHGSKRRSKNRLLYRKPLYIAFHADGQVKFVQRVVDIKYNERPVDYYKELEKVEEDWPKKPHTIWFLGKPIKLRDFRKEPLQSGPIGQRHVLCDFDLLLTCRTVKEIEERMKERR